MVRSHFATGKKDLAGIQQTHFCAIDSCWAPECSFEWDVLKQNTISVGLDGKLNTQLKKHETHKLYSTHEDFIYLLLQQMVLASKPSFI